jgi:hypothetical protein
MFMSPESMPAIAIYFHPYTFRGADRPHGFSYCLRGCVGEGFTGQCLAHGTVFGPMARIEDELLIDANVGRMQPAAANIVFQWIKDGHVPYLPADRPIGHLGSCLKPPVMEYIRERWIRPPGKNATDEQRRIYEARMHAREQRQMKGPDHV